MELRALAERILLHPDLEVKLTCPDKVTDETRESRYFTI